MPLSVWQIRNRHAITILITYLPHSPNQSGCSIMKWDIRSVKVGSMRRQSVLHMDYKNQLVLNGLLNEIGEAVAET